MSEHDTRKVARPPQPPGDLRAGYRSGYDGVDPSERMPEEYQRYERDIPCGAPPRMAAPRAIRWIVPVAILVVVALTIYFIVR